MKFGQHFPRFLARCSPLKLQAVDFGWASLSRTVVDCFTRDSFNQLIALGCSIDLVTDDDLDQFLDKCGGQLKYLDVMEENSNPQHFTMFLNRCKALEFLRIVEFNQPFRASQLSSILQKPTLGQHLRYLSVGVRGLPREINNLIKALAKRCTNLEILEMTMQVVEPMTAVAPAPPGPQAPAPAAVVGPPAGTATTPPAAARRPARRSKMCPITEETMLLLLKRCPRLRKIMGSKHWKNHRFTDKFLVREMARLVDVRAELDVLKYFEMYARMEVGNSL